MPRTRHPDDRIVAAVWIGKPKGAEAKDRLYEDLRRRLRGYTAGPQPVVVSGERLMPVQELVEIFCDESVFVESVVFQARKKGFAKASALFIFFSPSGSAIWLDRPPEGELVYLGLFACPSEAAYR